MDAAALAVLVGLPCAVALAVWFSVRATAARDVVALLPAACRHKLVWFDRNRRAVYLACLGAELALAAYAVGR